MTIRSQVFWRLTCFCLAACVGLSGCETAPEPVKAAAPRVTVQHPESRDVVDYREYNGWMMPSQNVEIRSRVRGHIQKIHFQDGQIVEKDQLLFELDPRPFAADVEVAKSELAVAEAQLEFAAAEEAREQDLFEKKINTKADLQKAVATRKTWEAQVVSAKEDITRKELDLNYSRITSPLKGKISRAMLDVGNLVNAGGTDPLLTTIVAIDPIFVYFYVDERTVLEYRNSDVARRAKLDQQSLIESRLPFEFGLETDTGYPHQGILDFSENRIDSTTGTYELRGQVENKEMIYIPGSRVRVRVPMGTPKASVLIPDEAILSDQSQRYVLCLNSDNVVYRKTLTLGKLLDDGQRVILPGRTEDSTLQPDDQVIVEGLQRARVNYPVEPFDAAGQPMQRKAAPDSTASR